MALRLILVGLVAGLGLSLPSRRDLDALGRSAQRWVNTRLAEWDAGTTVEEGSYVLIAEPVTASPGAAAVPLASDQEFAVVMDEMVAAFAHAEVADRSREQAEPTAEIAPVEASRSLAIALPTEPAAEESDRTDLAFDAVMDETVATFAAGLAAPAGRTVAKLDIRAWAEELAMLLATDALIHGEVGPPPTPVASYEPLEIGENLYPGEAYALNQLSEGLAEPVGPAVEEARAAESRLTHAMRLTREAVVAWGSLLHGPAVVTIAH